MHVVTHLPIIIIGFTLAVSYPSHLFLRFFGKGGTVKKKNLLINRLDNERLQTLLGNEYLHECFNIYTADCDKPPCVNPKVKSHRVLPQIEDRQRGIASLPQCAQLWEFYRETLEHLHIDIVLNKQVLHPYGEALSQACKITETPMLWFETFIGDRLILDWNGLPYMFWNDIRRYRQSIPPLKCTNLPTTTKVEQSFHALEPAYLKQENIVGILGQIWWDKSVQRTRGFASYRVWLDALVRENPNVNFILKTHPLQAKDLTPFEWILKQPNVCMTNASLKGFFDGLQHFVAYSSTTVFEGLLRGKTLATGGFHLCLHPQLVYDAWHPRFVKNLWRHLQQQRISQQIFKEYCNFICNYYALSMRSRVFVDKLLVSPQQFYTHTWKPENWPW